MAADSFPWPSFVLRQNDCADDDVVSNVGASTAVSVLDVVSEDVLDGVGYPAMLYRPIAMHFRDRSILPGGRTGRLNRRKTGV